MKMPEDHRVDEAKAYLRERLNAQLSMQVNLEYVMMVAVKDIVDISYRYNISPYKFRFSANRYLHEEVDAIILALIEMIEDYTYTLAVGGHDEHREEILAYIRRLSHGKTFTERVREYTSRFSKELEAAIAAGIALGVTKDALVSSIKSSIKRPLDNPYVKDAIKEGHSVITRIGAQTSFGIGRTVSSWTALGDLTEYAVMEGWMRNWWMEMKNTGMDGFYVMRGSSYPCSICDDAVGFHTGWDKMPPYHGHCCCIAVPINI